MLEKEEEWDSLYSHRVKLPGLVFGELKRTDDMTAGGRARTRTSSILSIRAYDSPIPRVVGIYTVRIRVRDSSTTVESLDDDTTPEIAYSGMYVNVVHGISSDANHRALVNFYRRSFMHEYGALKRCSHSPSMQQIVHNEEGSPHHHPSHNPPSTRIPTIIRPLS